MTTEAACWQRLACVRPVCWACGVTDRPWRQGPAPARKAPHVLASEPHVLASERPPFGSRWMVGGSNFMILYLVTKPRKGSPRAQRASSGQHSASSPPPARPNTTSHTSNARGAETQALPLLESSVRRYPRPASRSGPAAPLSATILCQVVQRWKLLPPRLRPQRALGARSSLPPSPPFPRSEFLTIWSVA